jgi:hypothetical protein
LSHNHNPFVLVIFQIGSCVFAQSWPHIMILLTASFVARITDIYHSA